MIVGERLRSLREEKNFSQGEIEKRTGLLRCYISRVENGHTVPAVETLEKFARALEVPMYQLLYDGEKPPLLPSELKKRISGENLWGSTGRDARTLTKLRRLLGKANEEDTQLLLKRWPERTATSNPRFAGRASQSVVASSSSPRVAIACRRVGNTRPSVGVPPSSLRGAIFRFLSGRAQAALRAYSCETFALYCV
jgi:transcriptional regulator with XRE-family HTH domain